MNIIIPAAGLGKRFVDDGYSLPKPLIPVLGEPMIVQAIKSLKIKAGDRLWIVYHQELDQYQFQSVLRKQLYDLDLNFVRLNYHTRGPAETVLCGINQVPDLDSGVLVIDCDTFYGDNVAGIFRAFSENVIFYFDDRSTEFIFSYIQLNADHDVIDIQEKNRISDHACVGAYGFQSGKTLKEYCEVVLDGEIKSQNEFYLSNVYAAMLRDDITISAIYVKDFTCVGTPQQLKTYCLRGTDNKKRFCFDLDGTLVTFPRVYGDYATVEPIWKAIKFARYLHSQGHTILIQTSRNMLSSQFNAGRAAWRAHEEIFKTLERFDIPCDEIYFGKPFAHFYIDDLAILPADLEMSTGFYNTRVESRHFNQIEYGPDWVRKTTNNPGEIYFYQHIPPSIRDYFPIHFVINENKIRIEKIDGIVFSYLLINNSLTFHNLDVLLDVVERIHKVESVPELGMDYSLNYSDKMTSRYKTFDYYAVAPEAHYYFNSILKELESHIPCAGVIHGDLVFSNIFLCENQTIKLIDMRGRVGNVDTIFGDIFYDYAKIYQSLWGYDFILNDCSINYDYLLNLRGYFEEKFINQFGMERFNILKYLTACLLFSMIPLHTDLDKQKKYFDLLRSILP
jgi:capsule biosynthesis phosphatase